MHYETIIRSGNCFSFFFFFFLFFKMYKGKLLCSTVKMVITMSVQVYLFLHGFLNQKEMQIMRAYSVSHPILVRSFATYN